MVQSMFGTDGVRGRANSHPMTPEVALRLGQAAGRLLRRGPHRHRAVIGKDTRLSGYMIESALQAGFTSSGFDVFLLGPAPTPAVGMLTRSLRADVGVMVSASHNPSQDNGIKLFGPDGYKISDALEARLEDDMAGPPARSPADAIGRARRLDGAAERYVEFAKATFPKTLRLDGLKVVLDCANGAAYKIAPLVLWELGAEVIPISVAPDGANINAGCGSTSPEACQRAVVLHGADLGIALDGDADRVLLIDETGAVADGDQILALIAARWSGEGRLTGGALVTTVMSNLGLERWLAGRGIGTLRTRVGDRHVVQRMQEAGCNIGGEQSGHIIMTDFTTTGDGLIAGLQVLAALIETGQPASETLRLFEPVPQALRNVRVARGSDILAEPSVRAVIAAVETRLGREGRLLVRPSGTEPMIRVMVEANDPVAVAEAVDDVCEAIAARG